MMAIRNPPVANIVPSPWAPTVTLDASRGPGFWLGAGVVLGLGAYSWIGLAIWALS